MKKLCWFLLALLPASPMLAKTFTFNFTQGKQAQWSHLANWSNNEYPQNLAQTDSVLILAPDNSRGWVCRVDTNFSSIGNFRVGENIRFQIDSAKTFELHQPNCGSFEKSKLHLPASSELVILGHIRLYKSLIQSKGPVNIIGQLSLDEEIGNCPSAGFFAEATTRVSGSINSIAGQIEVGEIWVTSTGSIMLQQGEDLHSSLKAAHFIQQGAISSSGTGNRMDVDGMLNTGTIELFYGNTVMVNSYFENSGTFKLDGELVLNGTIGNTGVFFAKGIPSQYSNTDYATINGSMVNNGQMWLAYKNYSLNGHFVNDSMFLIENNEYDYKIIDWNMSGINNGSFSSGTTLHINQHFINQDRMWLTRTLDSTRLNSPFINQGKLTCNGPTVFGTAFINKGELILEE